VSAPAKVGAPGDTRARLLDAAEELYAEKGVGGTSLRALTKRAGANLAAVSYHFGSKDGLLDALLERRIAPVNALRMARLDELEEGAGGGVVPLRDLLRAFLEGPLRYIGGLGDRGALVMRFLGRCHTEPRAQVHDRFRAHFEPTVTRFHAAFARALPELDPAEVMWRMMATVGVMIFFLSHPPVPDCGIEGLPPVTDPDEMLERIVAFVEPGFRG